jgi:hypothetical protein
MNANYQLNYVVASKMKAKKTRTSNYTITQKLKAITYTLQLFDGIWSIPLAFLLFTVVGTFSYQYFGDALISTEYLQYVILAALVMIIANFVVFLGIRFNFRALQREIYSNRMKEALNTDLDTWQKVKLYMLLYFGYFSFYALVLYMLMMATA